MMISCELFKNCLWAYIENTHKRKGFKYFALSYTFNHLQFIWNYSAEFQEARTQCPIFNKDSFIRKAGQLLRKGKDLSLDESIFLAVAEVCVINDLNINLPVNQRVKRMVDAFGFDSANDMYFGLEIVQYPLWVKLEEFFRRMGLILLMPENRQKNGAWRYIRYPLQQCLINYPNAYLLFKNLSQDKDKYIWNPKDFFIQCNKKLEELTLPSKKNLLNQSGFQNCLRQMLYAEFLYWNEQTLGPSKTPLSLSKKSHSKVQEEEYTLQPKKDWQLNQNGTPLKSLPTSFNEATIFAFDPNYEDWVRCNSVAEGETVAILIKGNITSFPQNATKHPVNGIPDYLVYVLPAGWQSNNRSELLKSIKSKVRPATTIYTFIGGLTPYRKRRCWYDFALPQIKLHNQVKQIKLDNKDVSVSNCLVDLAKQPLKQTSTGQHTLQLPGYSETINFTVLESVKDFNDANLQGGWQLQQPNLWGQFKEMPQEGFLQGLSFTPPPRDEAQSPKEKIISVWYQYTFHHKNPAFAAYMKKVHNGI